MMISKEAFTKEMNELKKEMKCMRAEMSKLMIAMQKEMADMRKELSEQQKSVQFMSQCFDDLKAENEKMKKRMCALESMNDKLIEKNSKFEKQMVADSNERKEVEENVLELKNEKLQNNLEVVGIPSNEKENCIEAVHKIVSKIDESIKLDDIADAYRIGNPKNMNGEPKKTRPMLVKFKERKVRNYIFHNKRRLRANSQQNEGQQQEKIFINENLCKETKELFRKANQKRKELKYRFIWSNFGKILIRKGENDRVVCIKCAKDLELIV